LLELEVLVEMDLDTALLRPLPVQESSPRAEVTETELDLLELVELDLLELEVLVEMELDTALLRPLPVQESSPRAEVTGTALTALAAARARTKVLNMVDIVGFGCEKKMWKGIKCERSECGENVERRCRSNGTGET
jgi:hypothetical protein